MNDGRRRKTKTTDGRTPDHEYPISSTIGSGELKTNIKTHTKKTTKTNDRNDYKIEKDNFEIAKCARTFNEEKYI